MNFADKIISWEKLPAWIREQRAAGRRFIVTNGCFDILHRGHVNYLQSARNLEAEAILLVGLNSDASVRELKGPSRPVNSEADRAAVLAALESVGGVCVFPDLTAMNFLHIVRPDLYVKGGDYTIDTINQEERRFVEGAGGRVVVLGGVLGKSTSALIEKISRL